jgi:hypothetical protein
MAKAEARTAELNIVICINMVSSNCLEEEEVMMMESDPGNAV